MIAASGDAIESEDRRIWNDGFEPPAARVARGYPRTVVWLGAKS
jgi:hypothetical protein